MTKDNLEKIRRLLLGFATACDNHLYKWGDFSQEEKDCEEMIAAIDTELDFRERFRKLNPEG